jgi:hypothetical protein
MFAAWMEPERFRQREQWQYWKNRYGGFTSKATAPQTQLPVGMRDTIAAKRSSGSGVAIEGATMRAARLVVVARPAHADPAQRFVEDGCAQLMTLLHQPPSPQRHGGIEPHGELPT